MQIHINLFLRTEGFHYAAWRHELSQPQRAMDVTRKIEMVQLAERGLFDSVFLADGLALGDNPWQWMGNGFEPLTMLSAFAMVTSHIGLIATASTTYNEPYNLARQFASLDHISGARAGWNIVTSQNLNASQNFGMEKPMSHTDRYLRAPEFLDVVLKLWDSWEDDAIVANKQSGTFVDPSKVHLIEHAGEHFHVQGPLNVPRPPQGHPLLVQAGSSEEGMAFGARVADAVFTSQHTIEEGRQFYKAFKELGANFGRDPETIKILPGLAPILGSTEAEAKALANELEELTDPTYSLRVLSTILQMDLMSYSLDEPFPLEDVPPADEIQGARSRYQLIVDMCRRDGLTLRQLVKWHISGAAHRTFIGTPEQLADDIEFWVSTGGSDGFNLMPSMNENGLRVFVDEVVPLLQRKGLFRSEYEATTLRGLYGLSPRVERNEALAKVS